MERNKVVYILRGLAGSGKTKWAEAFIEEFEGSHCIVSAKDFFHRNGKYKFEHTKLQEAHNYCFENFVKAVVQDKVDLVIVDNTNSTRREYSHYVILGRACGYEVVVMEFKCVDPDCLEANRYLSERNVPMHTISSMKKRWEKDPEAIFV